MTGSVVRPPLSSAPGRPGAARRNGELRDDVLGGSKPRTQDDVVWLPIVEHDDSHVELLAVLDSRPATHIAIGMACA